MGGRDRGKGGAACATAASLVGIEPGGPRWGEEKADWGREIRGLVSRDLWIDIGIYESLIIRMNMNVPLGRNAFCEYSGG